MNPIAHLFRLIYIWLVILRFALLDILLRKGKLRYCRFLVWLNPWHYFPKDTRGARIRRSLEHLGPIFVKFGQVLSTRLDLLPEDIAAELVKLQDQVPPFSSVKAKKIIKRELNKPVTELFAKFEDDALASASVAQVHAAELFTGERVIVKVLRPKMEQVIERDLSLLRTLAKIFVWLYPDAKRFRPVDVIGEFDKTLHDELDLMREAANASQLKRNFTNSNLIYVPEIHWDLTSQSVMTMERIYGVPIMDLETLRARNVNMKVLAERGVKIFFTQVFRDCFFHADMHPGNIFVNIDNPEDPQYEAVDFGIVGTLSPEDQNYLAHNFLAFFNRDYRLVAELHIDSGWVPEGTRVEEFESAIRTVCEPIFERPLKDISVGHTLLRLFQTARRFNMEVQPQLVLLQKTLLSVEGLGRQLYPELDLWNTAKPFLEDWMKKKIGVKHIYREVKRSAPTWLDEIPRAPILLNKALKNLADVNKSKPIDTTTTLNVGVAYAILGASFIIAAAVVFGFLWINDHGFGLQIFLMPAVLFFVALLFFHKAETS